MTAARPCRVLMVYPRFSGATFWNFAGACELVGARYPTAPLGLITVAALLPPSWNIRLVNRNTEDLSDDDLAWADVVMTSSMQSQQVDALDLIELCRRHGKPIVVGGPDPTASPHVYDAADFQVLGEAESVIDAFVAAWEAGERRGRFVAPRFQVDVTRTPVPRFDLLKFEQYLYVGVQFSRGCPFTCEFCDIIELYGRVPRAKTTAQMLAELEHLYASGYRGHVDFVDDNLIGNKKALKVFLPKLAAWLKARDYPFEFSTEASVNLADDAELLQLMREANFFAVFVGIESPDPRTLAATRKKQNTRRNLADSIHKIYSAGMFVTAGFIVGFDTEQVAIADAMADFIDEAAIPVAMVGLLRALPETQLKRRLEQEGRLHAGYEVVTREFGDHCTAALNFDPLRPLGEVLQDYRRVLQRIYDPDAYADRLDRLITLLDRSGRPPELPEGDVRRNLPALEMVHRIIGKVPEARQRFWRTFVQCRQQNPAALRYILMLMAFYLHLGPFSKHVIAVLDQSIAELHTAPPPRRAPAAALAAAVR